MPKSSNSAAALKPYKEFPLTPHRGGRQWCKKHRGTSYYFGPLDNWQAALARFEREWPWIIQGLTPPVLAGDAEACTLRALCNLFLESKRNKIAAGELTDLSYRDYFRSCKRLIDHFGADRRVDDLRPVDFEAFRAKLAKRLGVTALGNEVNRCRVILKYASDQRIIPQPVHFGQSFDRPSKKAHRKVRNESAPRMFTKPELRTILDALDGKPVIVKGEAEPLTLTPDPQLKAMALLGLNAGLGVTDCANLNESHIDLSAGWLDYPRVKTETPRRAPLWPETTEALKVAIATRKRPRDEADDGIVFLTRTRRRWVRTKQGKTPEKNLHLNALSQAFGKLLHKLNINGRAGLNFYTLRRQFEIIGGESRDQVAVDAIMGHVDESMAAVYRQGVISDDRLRGVVDHVRRWLFDVKENDVTEAEPATAVTLRKKPTAMTLDGMRDYIASVRWQFAKTMPQSPHEYTLRKWAPDREKEFEAVVMFIREVGYKKKYGKATYKYVDVDGWCYWTMGAPLDKTILINRAKLTDEGRN